MNTKVVLMLILLLAGVVQADPTVTTDVYRIDSSTTRTYDPLSIPRWQIFAGEADGKVGLLMANYFPTTSTTFYMSNNLDSTTRWVLKKTESPTYQAHNHGHISFYKDTVYWGRSAKQSIRMYSLGTSSMTELATWSSNFTTDANQYVIAVQRVPGSDTVLAVSRGTTEPGNTNILYWLSDDKGVTFDSMGLAVNYTAVGSDIRIGMFLYDNSVGIVADTAHTGIVSNGPSLYWWNRSTQSWTSLGKPFTTTSDGYRCFGAIADKDTTLISWHAKDDAGASDMDTFLVAYKHKGGSWSSQTKIFAGSGTGEAMAPYLSMSHILATGRTVMFHNFHVGATADIFMRYMKSDYTWSDTIRVTNNGAAWKFTTIQQVPAAHGDVTYLSYTFDTVIAGTTYHMANMVRVNFLETADTVVMSSFPYTITQDSTTYIMNANGSSTTNGIMFDNTSNATIEDIVIDGQGYNLTFGTAGTAHSGSSPEISDIGIQMASKSINRMVVKNVKFLHNPPASERDSTNECWAMGMRWGASVRNSTIDNCTFKVVGRQSKISWAAGGSLQYNNDIKDCIFIDSCHAWERRDYWVEQAMMVFWGHNTIPTASDFQYHFKIYGCSTAVAFWNNLYIESDSGVFDVYDNYWKSDGWNSLYGVLQLPSAGNNMTTATENYVIALRADNVVAQGNRIKFHDNVIESGSDHSGSRGIFVSGVESVNWNYDDSAVAIYNNTFNIHNGFDGYVGYTIGILIRDAWKGVRVHNNTWDIPNYHTPPNGSYSNGPSTGLRLTANPGENLYFRHNTVKCYFVDAFTWDETNGDAGEQASCVHPDENEMNSGNLWVDSNTFITNNIFFDIGYGNGNGGNFQTIGNKFEWYGGQYSTGADRWVWYAGNVWNNTINSYGNWLQDSRFDSSIAETKLMASDAEADSVQIGLKYTLTVTVIDTLDQPVSGAAVTVTNAYGHQVASGTTNASGIYAPVVKTYDLYNDTWSNPDSTAFNPFVVEASLGADSADTSYTVSWNTKAVTLTLAATAAPPDTTAPARTVIRGNVIFKGNVVLRRRQE